MLLSKLELNGFKSFPDRIHLRFDEGIMGVVGPNGCGKTNILDSIRWVLGEQRTSLLRASKVEEVIFNGTSHLKAADMAEVTLTIKNNRGVLPLEYNEVEVTRRLFRSGESEYLLNRNRCRLKDITELFADTGMGAHAYSIFQQGMVDAILSDKTEDRRYLFEEAAGITKYKNRKKESLKKLDNTESDLIRLSDIIAEIAKNVRSLQRQAGKARKYKRVKEELQQLEIARASARVYELQMKIDGHEKDINDRKTQKEALNSKLDSTESTIQELKLETDKLNEKIASEAAIESDFSQQALKAENSLATMQARLDSGKSNVEMWRSEIESLNKRIDSLKEQRKQTEHKSAETAGELNELNRVIEDIENKVVSAKDALDSSQLELEDEKNKLHKCENEISTDKAKLDAVDDSIERLENLSRDLDQSLSKYQARKNSSQETLAAKKSDLQKRENEITVVDERIQANQKAHLRINAEIEDLKREISSAQSEKSAVEAKVELLSRMVLEHEGYGSGVKALFAWDDKPDGVIDTLANLITADPEYHDAIEAALGVYGQLVVCRGRQDALTSINYLAENSAGRVAFLILESVKSDEFNTAAGDGEGFIDSVAALIQCQDYLRPAIKTLFDSIAVFKAGSIPENYRGEAVDLRGTYFNQLGIFEGGKSGVTLIGRKGELTDLQDLAVNIDEKINDLSSDLEMKRNELQNSAKDAESLGIEKRNIQNARETLISEMTRLEFEFQESIARLNELQQSSSETDKQVESLRHEKDGIDGRIESKERTKQTIIDALEKLAAGHKSLSSGYEQAVDKLNQSRLKMVELNGLVHKLDEDAVRYEEMMEEAGKMIRQKEIMIADERNKWHELETRMETAKGQISKLFEAKDQVQEKKLALNNERRGLVEKLTDDEARLKDLRAQINVINEEIHQQELKFAEYENSIKNIAEQIYHEYGVRISATIMEDYDADNVESEIERLRRELEHIGQVNMLADEEYATEKDRLEFLEKQYEDLLEAKKSLLDVIRKINKTAEEKFSETFELIKENFQNVFETLFEGGTADIRLVDPDDLLESPIDITARPGSKKLVSVNQLSGGERALTAISLLFSIYMVKPSPFCILDEIDAPLDDANVTRFLKLINRFTHSTQFIVITHNKKTMEAADLLYGITMERPGVSNIVSVKFNGNMVENVQQV